jgi:hypothetical protein
VGKKYEGSIHIINHKAPRPLSLKLHSEGPEDILTHQIPVARGGIVKEGRIPVLFILEGHAHDVTSRI